jgi:acyl-CoA hydrolase
MEIYVTLYRVHPESKGQELIGEAYMTFVSLKKDGKKLIVPELILETADDHYHYSNSCIRLNYRRALAKVFEESRNNSLPPGQIVNDYTSRSLTKLISGKAILKGLAYLKLKYI